MYKRVYDNFDGAVVDLSRLVRDRVDEEIRAIESGPFRRLIPGRGDIKIEVECRYKGVFSEKTINAISERMRAEGEDAPEVETSRDENHAVVLDGRHQFTVRRTSTPVSLETIIVKKRVTFPPGSPAVAIMNALERYGLKIAVSLEIDGSKTGLGKELTRRTAGPPLVRHKTRTVYRLRRARPELHVTRVREREKTRLEIEADVTMPYTELTDDPLSKLGAAIRGFDAIGRTTVFQSPRLLPTEFLRSSIAHINRGLGVDGRGEDADERIVAAIPQARNLRVEDLLRENYGRGYAMTPKADGYRYFMVVLEHHVVLVQPPGGYRVLYEGAGIPPTWVGLVLDGELIERANWRTENLNNAFLDGVTTYFCIFDVVSGIPAEHAGDVLRRISYLKNMFEEIRRGGVPSTVFRWAKTFDSVFFNDPLPGRLGGRVHKTMLEIKHYDDAVGSPWAAAGGFFDSLRPRLRYVDDGIILTPIGRTYRELNEVMSLKWKPATLASIDFLHRGGDLLVLDPTTRDMVPFRGSPPHTFEGVPTLEGVTVPLEEGRVYEFVYDPTRQTFRFTRPRPDKIIPNKLNNALAVWADVHSPIPADLLRGEGAEGVIACLRESLWSWFRVLGRGSRTVVDLTNLTPQRDFPARVREEGFDFVFRDTVVYRCLSSGPVAGYGFPRSVEANDLRAIPEEIDLLVIDGAQLMLFEGRIKTTLASNVSPIDVVDCIRDLLPRAKRVFIRGLTMLPEGRGFIPDRAAFGQNEELTVTRPADGDGTHVRLHFRPGGIFPGSFTETHCYQRTLPEGTIYAPAGHRVSANLEDRGPDNVLCGKHFGVVWDFVYNALVDPGYVSSRRTAPLRPTPPETNPIDDLMGELRGMDLGEQRVEEEAEPVADESADFILLDEERLDLGSLLVDRTTEPVRAPLVGILAKMITMIREGPYSPVEATSLATSLALSLSSVSADETVLEEIHRKLGVTVIAVRRIEGAHRRATAFNKSPRFGYMFVESSARALSTTEECRLITYNGRPLVHPRDPLAGLVLRSPLNATINVSTDPVYRLAPTRSGPFDHAIRNQGPEIRWKNLYRLFLAYPYAGEELFEPLIVAIATESTDKKAEFLAQMDVPPRFRNQPWARPVRDIIDRIRARGRARGVDPTPRPPSYEALPDILTARARRELVDTGNAFLYDATVPNNEYGVILMGIRPTLRAAIPR